MIKGFEGEIEEVEGHLAQLTRYAIRYLKDLKKNYGKGRERKTEICREEDGSLAPFDRINAAQVVVANETLYLNRKDGFAGYGLKKDEPVEKCSTLDDIIVFGKDGLMKVMKIAEKMFVGKSPLRVNVFRRDEEKVYNMVYRDGSSGRLYAKKFKVGGVTRDKEYPLFKTHSKSRIFFFAVHDNEKKNSNILVHLDPELKRVKEMVIEFDFAWIDLQGRGAKGTTLTAHKVDRVVNTPRENGSEDEAEEKRMSLKQLRMNHLLNRTNQAQLLPNLLMLEKKTLLKVRKRRRKSQKGKIPEVRQLSSFNDLEQGSRYDLSIPLFPQVMFRPIPSEEVYRKLLHVLVVVLPLGIFYIPIYYSFSRSDVAWSTLVILLLSIAIELFRFRSPAFGNWYFSSLAPCFGKRKISANWCHLCGRWYFFMCLFKSG